MPSINTHYAYLLPKGESGIVNSWKNCEKKVSGINGARYKGFKSLKEAKEWLALGAKYEIKKKKKMPDGVYFDAGTGRGDGVEISVTDKNGKNLLDKAIDSKLLNKHGKYLLPKGKTNNYGELISAKYALKIASLIKEKNIFGDSRLVIDYWSKGMVKKEVNDETKLLVKEVYLLRREFEKNGGKISLISGNDNPADLGFHK
jgi:ribonuclease HI